MIRVVPATEEAARQVYGDRERRSFRGVAFERDEEVIGCAGLYLTNGAMVMFFDGDAQAVRREPRAVVKAYRMLLEIAKERGLLVIAHASEAAEASERLLKHMGFHRLSGRTFAWKC